MAIEAKKSVVVLSQVDELAKAISSKIAASNLIESVNVNGTAAPITDKVVDITVPTAVTDLTDGANYSTTEQMNTAIAAAVAGSAHLSYKKVENKEAIDPAAENADKFIYLVPKTTPGAGDSFDEYMVIDGKVEKVGDWSVDLSGYVEKEEGKGLSSNDFTSEFRAKLEAITEDANHVEAVEGSGAVTIDGTTVQLLRVATDEEFRAAMTLAGFTLTAPETGV